MRTGLTIKNLPRLPRYLWYVVKAFFVFQNPFSIVYHYILETSPRDRSILFRNGLSITSSGHPHDVATLFVVMIKKEYGSVRPGSVVVDIGANMGSFSIYAAHQGACKVYSYEPNGQAFASLVRNVEQNKMADIVLPNRYAVMGKDVAQAVIPQNASPYNQVLTSGQGAGDNEIVPAITLAKIIELNRIEQIDLLKMDCEGMEYSIFFEAPAEIFRKIREIRMEFHGTEVDNLIAYLEGQGFRVTYISRPDQILWMQRV